MNNLTHTLARAVYDKITIINTDDKDDSYKKSMAKWLLNYQFLSRMPGCSRRSPLLRIKASTIKGLGQGSRCCFEFARRKALRDACIDLPFSEYRYLTRRAVIALTWFSVLLNRPGLRFLKM